MNIPDKTRKLATKIKNTLTGLSALGKHVSAIQAIDYGYYGGGQIVIMAKIGEKDYVNIVAINKKMTMRDCGELVKELENRYGALPAFVDTGGPRAEWNAMYNEYRQLN